MLDNPCTVEQLLTLENVKAYFEFYKTFETFHKRPISPGPSKALWGSFCVLCETMVKAFPAAGAKKQKRKGKHLMEQIKKLRQELCGVLGQAGKR